MIFDVGSLVRLIFPVMAVLFGAFLAAGLSGNSKQKSKSNMQNLVGIVRRFLQKAQLHQHNSSILLNFLLIHYLFG